MKKNICHAEQKEPIGKRGRSAWLGNNIFIVLTIAVILSACAPKSAPTVIPTVSLDDNTSAANTQTSDANSVSASAVIVPVNDAQLAFSSLGRVTNVDVKVGDQVKAGQTLVTLDTTIQEARVREAEANLAAAQAQVRYLKRLGVDQVHIESAEADAARAQALLDSANAVLASQSTLTAPFGGTIISLDIAPAEIAVPGSPLIVLGDLSSYKVETTDLSERNVTRVQIGQHATVFIEALGKELSGKVIDIARSSTTLGGDVVYKVTITLDEQPEGLLWGMSADVKIETAP
ncbi:MAG TPA: efflux RND transporter periplasmic adaptor subunit [Anaerolineales bacterium]|nr:efflux RND transporter periplasmic adaptor subunit [Anaerolineales bacterium]